MKRLFVLYDPQCAFCRHCRAWLEQQPAYVDLRFLAAESAEAECTIPGIKPFVAKNDLVVVGDDGAVYLGPNAFIICLYALVQYREWSVRLASPPLLPFARRFFDAISHHRETFSRWMRDHSDEELALKLRDGPVPSCGNETVSCMADLKRSASH